MIKDQSVIMTVHWEKMLWLTVQKNGVIGCTAKAFRILWLLPVLWLTCTGMPDEQREGLQEELIDIILRVLKRNPQLHYYQGYHDIVVTFLLVVKERYATALVEKLSTHHLRYSDVNLNSKLFFTLHAFILLLFVCQHALVSFFHLVQLQLFLWLLF